MIPWRGFRIGKVGRHGDGAADRQDDLATLRRRFAHEVAGAAGDARVEAAFGAVPREVFAGPGPWQIATRLGYEWTPDADPAQLYQDVLIALDPARGINIGEPGLHARCIAALALRPGEAVVHVGAGSGYYTAILAWLVAPDGRVDAYEIESSLAARARANLADRPFVHVHAASGAGPALPPADALYVSAGATHPLPEWLAALRPAGRLLFPLTPDRGVGGMLLLRRLGRRQDLYDASFVSLCMFIPCVGARDPAAAAALYAAFTGGGWEAVRALHVGTPPGPDAWCAGNGWWLGTRSPV